MDVKFGKSKNPQTAAQEDWLKPNKFYEVYGQNSIPNMKGSRSGRGHLGDLEGAFGWESFVEKSRRTNNTREEASFHDKQLQYRKFVHNYRWEATGFSEGPDWGGRGDRKPPGLAINVGMGDFKQAEHRGGRSGPPPHKVDLYLTL